jgi:tRNA G26 N,N-dimethylase Trm1
MAQHATEPGLRRFLVIIKEEAVIPSMGFFDMHQAAKKKKTEKIMPRDSLIKSIKAKGQKASRTHFSGTGIRTTMDFKNVEAAL